MDTERINQFFLEHTGNDIIPGACLIIYYNGNLYYKNSNGYANRAKNEWMTENTVLNFYSMSKPITCIAALTLYEKGLLDLEAPLSDYLSCFRHMSCKKIVCGKEVILPCEKPIRIRDLFQMTAGFHYDIKAKAIERLKKKMGGKADVISFAEELSKEPLEFEPGERWQYSFCHDILGAVIEKVSGMRFSEYVRESVFAPLGMERSTFSRKSELIGKIAEQYIYDASTNRSSLTTTDNAYVFGSEYESGGASLVSCAGDYSKFAFAIANNGVGQNGKRIVGKETIDLMKRNALSKVQLKTFDWPELQGYGYGLGVRTMLDPAASGYPGNVGEFGWNGSGGSYVLMDTDKKLSVVYTEHVLLGTGGGKRIHNALRGVIYSSLNS